MAMGTPVLVHPVPHEGSTSPSSGSLAFTMTVHQHVIPGMQADAARLFCEELYGEHAT